MKNKERAEKTLSEQEKKRLAKYNENKEKLIKEGYEEHNLTVSTAVANSVSFILGIILVAFFVLLFWLRGNTFALEEMHPGWMLLIYLSVLFVGTVIHELIHGVTYSLFAKNGFKDIEFGFIKESLNPYCVCNVALKKYQYLLGISMPCIILGVIPCIYAIFADSLGWLLIGSFNILGASGDLLIVCLIFTKPSKKKEAIYHDHPTEIGVVMFDK